MFNLNSRSIHVAQRHPEKNEINREETKGAKVSLIFLRVLRFFVVDFPMRI